MCMIGAMRGEAQGCVYLSVSVCSVTYIFEYIMCMVGAKRGEAQGRAYTHGFCAQVHTKQIYIDTCRHRNTYVHTDTYKFRLLTLHCPLGNAGETYMCTYTHKSHYVQIKK